MKKQLLLALALASAPVFADQATAPVAATATVHVAQSKRYPVQYGQGDNVKLKGALIGGGVELTTNFVCSRIIQLIVALYMSKHPNLLNDLDFSNFEHIRVLVTRFPKTYLAAFVSLFARAFLLEPYLREKACAAYEKHALKQGKKINPETLRKAARLSSWSNYLFGQQILAKLIG